MTGVISLISHVSVHEVKIEKRVRVDVKLTACEIICCGATRSHTRVVYIYRSGDSLLDVTREI
jgi:hypothetical protein